MNYKEIMKALDSGQRLYNTCWKKGNDNVFVYLNENGDLVNQKGWPVSFTFREPHNWESYSKCYFRRKWIIDKHGMYLDRLSAAYSKEQFDMYYRNLSANPPNQSDEWEEIYL